MPKPKKKLAKKPVWPSRRRSRPASRPAMLRRFRQIWADGFAFHSALSDGQIGMLREAMRETAADDAYWEKLAELTRTLRRVAQLRAALKGD